MLFSVWLKIQRKYRSKITVWEQQFFKKNFYGSFRIVSTWCRNIFWRAALKPFSVYGSNISDSLVFGNGPFGEMKYRSLRTRSFHTKKNCYESFRYVSMLRKKVFPGAPVKYFSLYWSNTRDFFSFGECCFWRDQRSQFENDMFSKKKCFQWKF